MSRVDYLLTVSKDLQQQFFDAGIIPTKSIVSFNPVNTDIFKPLSERASVLRNNIIFVARLEDYKGGVKVSNAFIRLHKKYPDWKLTFIGTGPDLENIKKIKDANGTAGDAIILKGQLSKKEIADEMATSSFFAMPCEHETFGLVYAEAMSAGIPVIAGNQTAPKEFIDESCGILVNPFSEEEIENAMEKMMNDYKNYDKKILRQNVVDKFGFVSFGKKLNGYYTTAIAEYQN